jgi:hypothetical protein
MLACADAEFGALARALVAGSSRNKEKRKSRPRAQKMARYFRMVA